ncbi:MAG: glycosyltransferase [Gammaproteobacteria bacterium]|nr:glycosyltransferase [Gammaproteobacteria bacterium]
MRIVHAIATLSATYGGPPKACLETAQAVAALGHEVSILTTDLGFPGRLDVPLDRPVDRNGVAVRYHRAVRPHFWGTSPALARALREAVPHADVVHLHSLYFHHTMAAARLCVRFGVPYVLQPHGALDPYLFRRHRCRKLIAEAWFQNEATRRAAALQFTTREEQSLAEPNTFGVRSMVVPIGLHPDDYAKLPPRGAFRARHPAIGNRPITLFLGRLNFKKGIDILIQAFAKATRAGLDAHLVLAGPDGGDRGLLESLIAEWGLRSRTTFTGMLVGEDKLALLADADLFVLSSWTENFGIAVVEAMACGLPVAISNRVNLWRSVAEADAGWVAPVESGAFRDILIEALADPGRGRVKGARGRALVAERYAWARIAPIQVQAYGSVLRVEDKRHE